MRNTLTEYTEELKLKDIKFGELFNEISETKTYYESKFNLYENRVMNSKVICKKTNYLD